MSLLLALKTNQKLTVNKNNCKRERILELEKVNAPTVKYLSALVLIDSPPGLEKLL